MSKKIKIAPAIQKSMGAEWQIEISETSFFKEKGANIPSFGYPCAICESKETKIRFAQSTEEEESNLQWMELQCKSCKNHTRYTRK